MTFRPPYQFDPFEPGCDLLQSLIVADHYGFAGYGRSSRGSGQAEAACNEFGRAKRNFAIANGGGHRTTAKRQQPRQQSDFSTIKTAAPWSQAADHFQQPYFAAAHYGGNFTPQVYFSAAQQTAATHYNPILRNTNSHSYQDSYWQPSYHQWQPQEYDPFYAQYNSQYQYSPYGYVHQHPTLTCDPRLAAEVPPQPQPDDDIVPPPPPDQEVVFRPRAPASVKQGLQANVPASHPRRPLVSNVEGHVFNAGQQILVPGSSRLLSSRTFGQTTKPRGDTVQPPIAPWRSRRTAAIVARERIAEDAAQASNRSFPRIPQFTKDRKQLLLKRPVPTKAYLEQANFAPVTSDAKRKLLIVLDLNGTLLHRRGRGAGFTARPRVHEFLHYLFTYHHVLIWSSARPVNVEKMSKTVLNGKQYEQLVACWSRDKLRLPPDVYELNVQVYKQLKWIWQEQEISFRNPDMADPWCQENTVLIDDSVEKAASEPYNLLALEEFEATKDQMSSDVLGQVVRYIDLLAQQRDVSAYMRSLPFRFDASETFDWRPIVMDMQLA